MPQWKVTASQERQFDFSCLINDDVSFKPEFKDLNSPTTHLCFWLLPSKAFFHHPDIPLVLPVSLYSHRPITSPKKMYMCIYTYVHCVCVCVFVCVYPLDASSIPPLISHPLLWQSAMSLDILLNNPGRQNCPWWRTTDVDFGGKKGWELVSDNVSWGTKWVI